MSVNIQTGNVVKIQSGNRVLISAPGPQGPAGPGGGVTDGDKGDITVTSSGAVWTIDTQAVTFAKMQHIATDHLLGRHSSGSGDVQQIGLAGGLQFQGSNLTIDGASITGITASQVGALEPTGDGSGLTGITATQVGALEPTGDGSGLTGITASQVGALADGDTLAQWLNFPLGGFRLLDTTGDHTLQVGFNEELTANRALNFVVNDAARTINLSGNLTVSSAATISGTNTGDISPAGTGSELQFRSTGTAFGAVTNSSHSSGAITLGAAEALGTTSTARLTLANTTAATSTVTQVSPSIVLEGRGWKTDATAASQIVRFRENILPVNGAANPSATWRLQSEINNSGTWTDRVTVDSAQILTAGRWSVSNNGNGFNFRVDNNSVFGARGVGGLNIHPSYFLGWSTNVSDLGEPPDLTLFRDAANTLAQRNGTNAQTFRLYETDSGANDEYLELSAAAGTNLIRPQATGTGTASVVRYHTTTAVFWTSGSGSPESVVTAPVGSLFTRTDGGAATTLYVKETGTGSTGWVAK
jgi:hypothetical protein